MIWLWVILGLVVGGVVAAILVWRPLRRLGRDIQVERARELFHLQRERLEAAFVGAARASGKPRGLRWRDCDFDADFLFARERRTGHLAALVGVTVRFEAIEGGDMEDVAAVPIPRNASAVFFFERGHWHTVGRAVFNLNPAEAISHFQQQYEPLPRPDSAAQGGAGPGQPPPVV